MLLHNLLSKQLLRNLLSNQLLHNLLCNHLLVYKETMHPCIICYVTSSISQMKLFLLAHVISCHQ